MTKPDASIIIKRYANRKLYNTRDSQYITLAQIAQLIEAGELVQIVDKASGEDITEMTLAQVFVDDRRKRPGAPPIEGLKDVFRSTSEQVRKQITEPVSNIRLIPAQNRGPLCHPSYITALQRYSPLSHVV